MAHFWQRKNTYCHPSPRRYSKLRWLFFPIFPALDTHPWLDSTGTDGETRLFHGETDYGSSGSRLDLDTMLAHQHQFARKN